MSFEIKKGVPIPRKGMALYPFDEMAIGDSFDAPRDMGKAANGGDRRQNSLTASAVQYAKKTGGTVKFTTRLIDENTVRCWRVA